MKGNARYRGLLIMLALMLVGGGIPIAYQGTSAQDGGAQKVAIPAGGAFQPAFTQVLEWQEGTPGQVDTDGLDTPENPGGGCYTDRSVSPAIMSIGIDYPTIHTAGGTTQTVAVETYLYQYEPGSGTSFNLVFVLEPDYYIVEPGSPVDPQTIEIINVPVGPTYVAVIGITWFDEANLSPSGPSSGFAAYRVDNYEVYYNDQYRGADVYCYPLVDAFASLSPTSGTVNTWTTFRLYYFPIEVAFEATWDGNPLTTTTTMTDYYGRSTGKFKVPDGQVKGDHTVTFTAGEWVATRIYTVKPRIKVIPGTVERGQQAKISLRGYNARETVRIRWRDSEGVWREIARVTTSSTGSAQVYLPVPAFAPDGANSVRGDAVLAGGTRAQTNAVFVTGGAFEPANAPTAEASPTTTATPDGTPSPEATVTESPNVEPTVEPTEPTAEPTVEPTTEPTTEPTVEPTVEPTIEPTVEPTIEPTVEPTAEPVTETPVSEEGATAQE